MQNSGNRKSRAGIRGVFPIGKRFKAQLVKNGKTMYLGTYSTPEEAHHAYLKAKAEHHRFQPVPRDHLSKAA